MFAPRSTADDPTRTNLSVEPKLDSVPGRREAPRSAERCDPPQPEHDFDIAAWFAMDEASLADERRIAECWYG